MRVFKNSYISDEFEGWDEDFVYELDDGSKWKLADFHFSYTFSFRPEAKILIDGSRYYLQVAGMPEKVEVVPVN